MIKQPFNFGEKEINALRQKDKKLAALIDATPKPIYEQIPDTFCALAYNIVGQQIAVKAANTVWQRLEDRLGTVTAHSVAAASTEQIQQCGMSLRKASYIKALAEEILCGSFVPESLSCLTDEEVCKRLVQLHGIGQWTAEMMLIFCLGRPNVVSWGDLGIRRGMERLYGHKQLTLQQFARYKKRYSPYGTVASFYLWALGNKK